MTDKLIQALRDNNVNEAIAILNHKDTVPTYDDCHAFVIAVERGFTEIVKLFLTNPKVDPSLRDNYCISISAQEGREDIVELLLKDPRVNPTATNNQAIKIAKHFSTFDKPINASQKTYLNIIQLLWNDKRVKNTLQKDNIDLYNKLTQQDIKNTIESF
jgi:hypothetical protein